MSTNGECSDYTAQMRMLSWACVVRKLYKNPFRPLRISYFLYKLLSESQRAKTLFFAEIWAQRRPESAYAFAQLRSLIRVFVVRMKKLCILGYPKSRCKCTLWRFWSLFYAQTDRAGWSEFLMDAHVRRYVFWSSGSNDFMSVCDSSSIQALGDKELDLIQARLAGLGTVLKGTPKFK